MKIMSNGWILNAVAKPAKEGKYLICTDSGYISDVSYYEYGWNKSSPDSENEFKKRLCVDAPARTSGGPEK